MKNKYKTKMKRNKIKGSLIDKSKIGKVSLKQLSPKYLRVEVTTSTKPSFETETNPEHYKGAIETFDYLKDKLSPEELAGFCKGNIIKYISRESKKGGVVDLTKAKWYLDKLIELK
jgi:hypothetical protein